MTMDRYVVYVCVEERRVGGSFTHIQAKQGQRYRDGDEGNTYLL